MKKKTKNNKSRITTFILFIAVIIVIGVGVYFFFLSSGEDNRLSISEKQWVEKNKSTLIDFKIPSNLSILSNNGNGFLLDFVSDIEKDTGLSFNKVSYTYPTEYKDNNIGVYVLKNGDSANNTDLLITEDNYVLIGKDIGYLNNELSIYGNKVGVLKTDTNYLKSYFNSNIAMSEYDDLGSLIDALNNDSVKYIIAPRYYILSSVIASDALNIKYSFSDLSNKVVFRYGNDEVLNSIVGKYVKNFINNDLKKYLEKSYMDFYVLNTKITDIEKSSLTSKNFTYGYVDDGIYNTTRLNKLYGLAGEYVNAFSSIGDITFEYVSYKSNEDLSNALIKGDIDMAFVNYKVDEGEYNATVNPFTSRLAVLSNNYQGLTSINSIDDRVLYVKENSYLADFITTNYKSFVNTFSTVPSTIDNYSLLVVDEAEYEINVKGSSDYSLLFVDSYDSNYHFAVNKNETVLYDFINYMLSNTDNNYYRSLAINNLAKNIKNNNSFKSIYMIIILAFLVPVLLIAFVSFINKRNRNMIGSKKEDILKYNDLLTSLKNRNYLNANINIWDKTKVYPRTIIIVDLNNLKYVNDNYGHEEGNALIKKAAAILINTQLEKSEIIRTDGNEFLIYLIGYSKAQINTYMSKLTKEFELLPHGFGAAVGYSMVDDEIKTIDDAINEATIEMRIDKEQNYR